MLMYMIYYLFRYMDADSATPLLPTYVRCIIYCMMNSIKYKHICSIKNLTVSPTPASLSPFPLSSPSFPLPFYHLFLVPSPFFILPETLSHIPIPSALFHLPSSISPLPSLLFHPHSSIPTLPYPLFHPHSCISPVSGLLFDFCVSVFTQGEFSHALECTNTSSGFSNGYLPLVYIDIYTKSTLRVCVCVCV